MILLQALGGKTDVLPDRHHEKDAEDLKQNSFYHQSVASTVLNTQILPIVFPLGFDPHLVTSEMNCECVWLTAALYVEIYLWTTSWMSHLTMLNAIKGFLQVWQTFKCLHFPVWDYPPSCLQRRKVWTLSFKRGLFRSKTKRISTMVHCNDAIPKCPYLGLDADYFLVIIYFGLFSISNIHPKWADRDLK